MLRIFRTRKAQSAIEFTMITVISLFGVLMGLVLVDNEISEINHEKNVQLLEDVSEIVRSEIEIANLAEPGYSRTFELPEKLAGRDYVIEYNKVGSGDDEFTLFSIRYDDREDYSQNEFVFFLPPDVVGPLTKGDEITIEKDDGGEVVINKERINCKSDSDCSDYSSCYECRQQMCQPVLYGEEDPLGGCSECDGAGGCLTCTFHSDCDYCHKCDGASCVPADYNPSKYCPQGKVCEGDELVNYEGTCSSGQCVSTKTDRPLCKKCVDTSTSAYYANIGSGEKDPDSGCICDGSGECLSVCSAGSCGVCQSCENGDCVTALDGTNPNDLCVAGETSCSEDGSKVFETLDKCYGGECKKQIIECGECKTCVVGDDGASCEPVEIGTDDGCPSGEVCNADGDCAVKCQTKGMVTGGCSPGRECIMVDETTGVCTTNCPEDKGCAPAQGSYFYQGVCNYDGQCYGGKLIRNEGTDNIIKSSCENWGASYSGYHTCMQNTFDMREDPFFVPEGICVLTESTVMCSSGMACEGEDTNNYYFSSPKCYEGGKCYMPRAVSDPDYPGFDIGVVCKDSFTATSDSCIVGTVGQGEICCSDAMCGTDADGVQLSCRPVPNDPAGRSACVPAECNSGPNNSPTDLVGNPLYLDDEAVDSYLKDYCFIVHGCPGHDPNPDMHSTDFGTFCRCNFVDGCSGETCETATASYQLREAKMITCGVCASEGEACNNNGDCCSGDCSGTPKVCQCTPDCSNECGTDGCGNYCDIEAPVAKCEDYSISLLSSDKVLTHSGNFEEGSTDNCDFTKSDDFQTYVDCEDLGTYTVTVTVTDDAGNSDTCTSKLDVVDGGGCTTCEGDPCVSDGDCCLGAQYCYKDLDGDGYGALGGGATCHATDLPMGDCCDTTASQGVLVNPGQTGYFDNPIVDIDCTYGYDYNCDGNPEKQDPNSCESFNAPVVTGSCPGPCSYDSFDTPSDIVACGQEYNYAFKATVADSGGNFITKTVDWNNYATDFCDFDNYNGVCSVDTVLTQKCACR